MLSNSNYGIVLCHHETNKKRSKIIITKYTTCTNICDVILNEHINYIVFNPRNSFELILCGKGYLRLWNLFINQKKMEEHPSKFLKGKAEKENDFIKAVFFSNKSFQFVVGTRASKFFLMTNYDLDQEINMRFMLNTSIDMKIENFLEKDEDLDNSDQNISLTRKLTKAVAFDADNSNLNLINFFIVRNSHLLLIYKEFSFTYVFDLKSFMNKKVYEENESDSEEDENQNILFRLSDHIPEIHDVILQEDKIVLDKNSKAVKGGPKPKIRIIFISEFNDYMIKDSRMAFLSCVLDFNTNKETKQIRPDLRFIEEKFQGLTFNDLPMQLELCEAKDIFYLLTSSNKLRIFRLSKQEEQTTCSFTDNIKTISCSPSANMIAISFDVKFCLFTLIKNKLVLLSEFEVEDSICAFSSKGDIIAIAGKSQNNDGIDLFSIYFVDAISLDTKYVIEDLNYVITSLKWFDTDNFICALTEDNRICGWEVHYDYITCRLSMIVTELAKETGKQPESYFFNLLIDNHFSKPIKCFEYDAKKDCLIILPLNGDSIEFYTEHGTEFIRKVTFENAPTEIKLLQDKELILVGDSKGKLIILNFAVLKNPNLNTEDRYRDKDKDKFRQKRSKTETIKLIDFHAKFSVNMHRMAVNAIKLFCNKSHILTCSADGSIYNSTVILNLLNKQTKRVYKEIYDDFEVDLSVYRPNFDKQIFDLSHFKAQEIMSIDGEIAKLEKDVSDISEYNLKSLESEKLKYEQDISNIQKGKEIEVRQEKEKLASLEATNERIKEDIDEEIAENERNHADNLNQMKDKYDKKLKIYVNEIDNLEKQLIALEKTIDTKFNEISRAQEDFYKREKEKYVTMKTQLVNSIETTLNKMVMDNVNFDAAIENSKEDYKKLIEITKNKLEEELANRKKDLKDNEKQFEEIEKINKEVKMNLDKKLAESDAVITQNYEIKQKIIDTIQRTITLTEQVLETEKNLLKIEQKQKDLSVKNKHLEQIRFVLEHRMTSLEKEKAPLEGQCSFLDKQKQNLQGEFGKLDLAIKLQSQRLENKQSQLKACLIQNFEVDEQNSYLRKKMIHVQNEVKAFIEKYKMMSNAPFKDRKYTNVALNLKKMYEKFFKNEIEEELMNYEENLKLLQQEHEKTNISNNNDLNLRDNAEEHKIAKTEMLAKLNTQKYNGFFRMQNQNTLLLSECKRLRVNLQEVLMHVMDMEKQFESLTNIKMTKNKHEIIQDIKGYVNKIHHQIKYNFDKKIKILEENSVVGCNVLTRWQ